MSEGLNQVTLLGNLGADPDLRYTQGGQAVLNIRLATTESYLDKDKTRQERTEWHQVVVWGARGEALSKILTKGSTILVVGGLRTTSYEDKNGEKRWKTEVHAKTVCLTGSRPKSAEEPAQPARQADARQPDARQHDARRADPRRGAPSRSDDDMPF